jgi:hypothetical protein
MTNYYINVMNANETIENTVENFRLNEESINGRLIIFETWKIKKFTTYET